MAQTVSKEMLLFKLSLACSSQNVENRTSDNEGSDTDDGIVFDIDPSLLVDCDKILIGDMIGKGSHSLVYKGWYEDRPIAIKVIHPKCKAKFEREVKLLSKIQHTNVVEFIGACVKPLMVIIIELLEGGSLQKAMNNIYPTTFSLEQCLSYAIDISQAMEYLHSNGIIHRDLKPGNLLLTRDKYNIKLADFGIARDNICDEMTCEAGTYRYMAPEILSKDPLPKGAKKSYDHKADVYSFAMVFWSMMKNQVPFKDRADLMAAYDALNNLRPCLDEFPEDISLLLQSCWMEDPKLRPEFTEITETLIRILHNVYRRKINGLASSIEVVEEVDSESEEEISRAQDTPTSFESTMEIENIAMHENETMKPNGESDGESQSGTKTSLSDLMEKKSKKKSKIKRFFSCCKCIAF
ncbi:serine/threonine/tyrosine-protein kinase HT1-like [Vicia villosa]|uniref:serine/threonine/tyrosine-protein kinase HT1-like n=1 Tax=Vicia villosa TaxID=3911 RepID=UPI00273A8F66|nr:serine/threonine/tyrosine-protein kinase HT1-like [Vicia villosa]